MHFDQKQVIVCAAADDAESALSYGRRHRFRVGHHLLLVFLERRLHRFFQTHGFGCDGVDERPTLRSGEGQLVQFLGERGFAENHAAARSAERLVGGGGNDVRVGNRAGMHACGDQPRDVRHVHKENRADRFRGFGDALEIDDARVRACSCHNHFRFVLACQALDFDVIDALVFFAHAVGHELVHAAGKIQGMPVGQVAAVGEIHAQNRIAWLQQGHVDGDVCGSSRVRLHVGVLGSEKFFRAVNG